METPLDSNIVHFPGSELPDAAESCAVCGAPRLAGSFCRECAFRLLEIGLAVDAGSDADALAEFSTADSRTALTPPLCYDHLEICVTAAGVPWELGRGSMGITYKAVDTRLGCPVALKIINPRRLAGHGAKERFLREARAAAGLRHANIASVFHLGLSDEDCYYTMEYIEGETLETRVRRTGALTCLEALNSVDQVARALRVAHAKGFTHRDIKPSNIMLVDGVDLSGRETAVKLIDFGLVKAEVESPVAADGVDRAYFAGTPVYASPEQRTFGRVDPRSDIYSLGQCLRFMLTGQPPPAAPFDEAGPWPAAVGALLHAMTAPDPMMRPQTAEDLSVRLRLCLHFCSGAARDEPGAGRQARKPILSRRAVVATLACCIVLALVTYIARSADHARVEARHKAARREATELRLQAEEYRNKYTAADNLRAVDLCERAIAADGEFADAHATLALALYQQVARYGSGADKLEQAVLSARRAIAIDPACVMAYEALGVIRSQQGRPWEALSELHRALEFSPEDIQALRYFGTLWQFVGRPQLALPFAKKVLGIEPANKRGWNAAADASVDLCDDEQGAADYRKCLEIDPRMTIAYCGLLHIDLLKGDFDQARKDYAMAESVNPGLQHSLALKAQIELFSGDYAAAEACYRRLLQLNRNGLISYFGGISYLSALGYLRLQATDPAEGNALLDEALAMHSNGAETEGPQTIYDLAAIRAIQNRKDDALTLLERAIRSGWIDFRSARLDPRFTSLREEAEFQRLLQSLERRVDEMRDEAMVRCQKTIVLADYPVATALP